MAPGPAFTLEALRRAARRSLTAVAVATFVVLAGCGDGLGPGASAEVEGLASASREEEARRRQAQTQAHFGMPAEIQDARGVRFRLIPAGTFRMGSPEQEPGRAPDEAIHAATLLVPYYLQATEATCGEVRAFDPALCPAGTLGRDHHPAQGLSHDQVLAFVSWVNAHDPVWYHRLPTEAEWERACRAGSEAAWSTGAVPPEDAWMGLTAGEPRKAGEGQANGFGLHDMHGNVAEWCRPWYAPYPASATDLPVGPTHGEARVVRGGSWGDAPAACRSAARHHAPPQSQDRRVGFRLLVEAGYGVPGLGSHRLRVQTYSGAIGTHPRAERPGVRLRLVSVPERLTARQEDRVIRWKTLEGVTPMEIQMLPGRYYLQAWRMEGDEVVRGPERKFMIPDDLPEVDVEVPPG